MSVFKVECVFNWFLLSVLSTTGFYYDETNESENSKTSGINSKLIPFHALVVYDMYFCSGTIIGSRIVLTTAHCFYNLNTDTEVVVKVGAEIMAGAGQIITVIEIKMHEYYNRETPVVNDIALLCLESHIYLGDRAVKVILEEEGIGIVPGAILQVTSWITNQNKNIADIGGPALFQNKLFGLLSFTESVTKLYSVAIFTNVTRFYKWIKKNTLRLLQKYCVEDDFDYYQPDYYEPNDYSIS